MLWNDYYKEYQRYPLHAMGILIKKINVLDASGLFHII